MKWSTRVTYGKYLRATALAMRPLTYIVFVVVAGGLGLLAARGTGVLASVVAAVVYVLILAGVAAAVIAFFARRNFRSAGTQVISYELSRKQLTYILGRDRAVIPRTGVRVLKTGNDFVALKREGRGLGPSFLFFDDPALASRVAAELS